MLANVRQRLSHAGSFTSQRTEISWDGQFSGVAWCFEVRSSTSRATFLVLSMRVMLAAMGVRHDGPFTAVDDLELVALCRTHRVNVNRLHGARRTAARSSTRTTATVRRTPSSNRCRENPASTSCGALHPTGCWSTGRTRRQIRAERPRLTKP